LKTSHEPKTTSAFQLSRLQLQPLMYKNRLKISISPDLKVNRSESLTRKRKKYFFTTQ